MQISMDLSLLNNFQTLFLIIVKYNKEHIIHFHQILIDIGIVKWAWVFKLR